MGRRKIRIDTEVAESPGQRFLNAARRCRTRDLTQVHVLCALVRETGELIHALQKERGASSIFLGSQGMQFSDCLTERVAECHELERAVRGRLENIERRLDPMSFGVRFNMAGALAFRALDSLRSTRKQIKSLALVPQDAVNCFTEIIGCLLAVIFEVADIAADPAISRALIGLVNFAQGKEYAGQERATGGAVFSRGSIHADEHRRMLQLITAQDQAFRIFGDFADPADVAAFHLIATGPEADGLKIMRQVALIGSRSGDVTGVTAEAWFRQTTRRIDALKTVEDRMSEQLRHLCTIKLAEDQSQSADTMNYTPGAMLVATVDPTSKTEGLTSGIGLYGVSGVQPKPMRSILTVLQAQSRRIEEVSHELESARNALLERKTIEKAKGLLMESRGLSEQQAYDQIRAAAMDQSKRVVEIAEAIVSTAPLLER